jgi:hypothetical protein
MSLDKWNVSGDPARVLPRECGLIVVCLMLVSLTIPAWAQSSSGPAAIFSPEIDAQCPEAVREAVELRSRVKIPRVPHVVTRPALRNNLLLMAKQDQEARASFSFAGGRGDPASDPGLARMIAVDSANLRRLKHIVDQDGFPTAEMVGLDGVSAAWLLAIHARSDPDFQERVLKLTNAHVRRGEVRGDQVATLMDDVLDGQGKPQRYGTNFEMRDGELKPSAMEDEANVDARRRAVGLGSLANNACVIRAAYGAKPAPVPGSPAVPQ